MYEGVDGTRYAISPEDLDNIVEYGSRFIGTAVTVLTSADSLKLHKWLSLDDIELAESNSEFIGSPPPNPIFIYYTMKASQVERNKAKQFSRSDPIVFKEAKTTWAKLNKRSVAAINSKKI